METAASKAIRNYFYPATVAEITNVVDGLNMPVRITPQTLTGAIRKAFRLLHSEPIIFKFWKKMI